MYAQCDFDRSDRIVTDGPSGAPLVGIFEFDSGITRARFVAVAEGFAANGELR